jgi:AraC-like DNA-binding protein
VEKAAFTGGSIALLLAVSRVCIEKSMNLRVNPNLRVSEIASDVGFQSLTHFNRVCKKIPGLSPAEHRAQLLGTQ